MKHLWINEKRIDTLDMLRAEFVSLLENESSLNRGLEQLLEKYDSGVLVCWIMQQEERYRFAGNKQKQIQEKLKTIKKCYDEDLRSYILQPEEAQSPTQEAKLCTKDDLYTVLAWLLIGDEYEQICGGIVKLLKAKEEKRMSVKAEGAMKAQVINSNDYVTEDIDELDSEWSATSDVQLRGILKRIVKENKGGVGALRNVTLYNVNGNDAGYTLDLRMVRNVTITGVGNPKVHYRYDAEHVDIDLVESNIVINDMTINFRKICCLKNTSACSNVVLKLAGEVVTKDE